MGRIEEILNRLEGLYPEADTMLAHESAFELLVAVILSAQATDESVNRVTPDLFRAFPTIEAFQEAPLAEIEKRIRSIGLYRNKARHIKATADMIVTRFGGKVPGDQDDLESLPGVGRKTANVVLSVWFKQPRIAVDTHVARVAKRLRLAEWEDSPLVVERKLMKVLPRESWSATHHRMILFGRYRCTARSPDCDACVLKEFCRYPDIRP